MKKIIVLILFFLFSITSAYALDLSDYPDFFIKGTDLDVIIIVGDKAPASDVLAQTQIALSLGQFGNALGISKLASEADYEEQNIISIGSPCYNEITAEIMDNPAPCDNDLIDGKAFIRMYENNNNVQIVIAGYNDKATREAANVLGNYQDYNLGGNEHIIDLKPEVEEETEKPKIIEAEESKTNEAITTEKKTEEKTKQAEESDEKNTKVETTEPESETKPQKEEKKELNMIERIVSWFKSLFGIK